MEAEVGLGVDRGVGARGVEEASGEFLLAPAAILEGLPDAVVAATSDGRIVFVNELAEELFGYRRDQLLGRPVNTLWPERFRERYDRNMQLYFATDHPLRFSSEVWGLRCDASEFVGEMSWGVVETVDGPLLLAVGRDISQRRAAEARLRAAAELGERALAGVELPDLARDAVKLIRTTLPILGAEVRLAGGVVLASSGPTTPGLVLPVGPSDQLVVVADGVLADDEMALVRAVANTLTSALARVRDEEQLRHEAVHDPLTGLANRVLLRDRLEHALARSERGGGTTGVMVVDLDDFKLVNDAYGHLAGDSVLTELSRRMRAAVRPSDTVARLGGDEFVAVCEGVDEQSALALGRRLQAAIRLPIAVGGVNQRLTASIGIALGRTDPDAILRDADVAVYRAKADGRGRLELFQVESQ
jgi:diguanylate cyclase (GGDEF)-like protein/PAS domain S-box-containing protein